MGELSPTILAIHQWIRDDAPVSIKLVITPVMISALADRIDAARSEAQPSGYDGLRQALAEAIEFAEQDWQALTPEGDAMLDRWRAALTFTASLSDASPSSGDE